MTRRTATAFLLGVVLFVAGLYGTRVLTPAPDQVSGNGIYPGALLTWLVAVAGYGVLLGVLGTAWHHGPRSRVINVLVGAAAAVAATATSIAALFAYADWVDDAKLPEAGTWPQYVLHHLTVNAWVWLTGALLALCAAALYNGRRSDR